MAKKKTKKSPKQTKPVKKAPARKASKPAAKKSSGKKKAQAPKLRAKTVTGDDVLLFHAMYVMARIDGATKESEFHVVEALLTTLPEFGKSSVDTLLAASASLAKEYGGVSESLIAFASIKSEATRIKCFLLSVEVAYASGGIGAAEAELLRFLAKALRLPPATTQPIVLVLGQKYAS